MNCCYLLKPQSNKEPVQITLERISYFRCRKQRSIHWVRQQSLWISLSSGKEKPFWLHFLYYWLFGSINKILCITPHMVWRMTKKEAEVKKPSQKFIEVDRELAWKAIPLLQYLLLFIIIDVFASAYTDALFSHVLFSPAFPQKKMHPKPWLGFAKHLKQLQLSSFEIVKQSHSHQDMLVLSAFA